MMEKNRFQVSGFRFQVAGILSAIFLISGMGRASAKEIAIIYTGETHAMIYHCNCPIEPDGGVARRSTMIKQLREKNPATLVFDSGAFMAGGVLDEYSVNQQLDVDRSVINLKAMDLMKYDAVNIDDDDFNFGREFLMNEIGKAAIPFVSCNIKSEKFAPYIIREVSGIKFGITGVANLSAMQKTGGLKFIDPKTAVRQAVEELKAAGVDIIVLLSRLDENEALDLIKDVKGIDIMLSGRGIPKGEMCSKVDSTIVIKPSWEGRRMNKLSLTVTGKKIAGYKFEELRLSDKIGADPAVKEFLPACFSDTNCARPGFTGTCNNPGAKNSECSLKEIPKVSLTVISSKDCTLCDTARMVEFLKAQFPGLVVTYLYYPDRAQADKLVKDFDLKALPFYFLGKEAEKEKAFAGLRENLEVKGDYYMLKPKFAGIAYFLERKPIKGKIDLFISLYTKNTSQLLDTIKDFNPSVHFLAMDKDNNFDAARGNLEVEDDLRAVCVEKYYPRIFWDYITCRARSVNSSWWEDCLGQLDSAKIRSCAKGDEAKTLLRENIAVVQETEAMFGPTYLLDNKEIFGTQGSPTKEDFKKIFRK